MIRAQIVKNPAYLNNIWPKAYVQNDDYENVSVISNMDEVEDLDEGGVFVEPLKQGWGTADDMVMTVFDGRQSVVVAYPMDLDVIPDPTTTAP